MLRIWLVGWLVGFTGRLTSFSNVISSITDIQEVKSYSILLVELDFIVLSDMCMLIKLIGRRTDKDMSTTPS